MLLQAVFCPGQRQPRAPEVEPEVVVSNPKAEKKLRRRGSVPTLSSQTSAEDPPTKKLKRTKTTELYFEQNRDGVLRAVERPQTPTRRKKKRSIFPPGSGGR